MKIKDLYEEIITDDGFGNIVAANPFYDVTVELNTLDHMPEDITVESIRWDHAEKKIILETD